MQCGLSSRDSPHGTEINSRIWLCLFMNTFQCCLFRMKPILIPLWHCRRSLLKCLARLRQEKREVVELIFASAALVTVLWYPFPVHPVAWHRVRCISSSRGYFYISSMVPVIGHERSRVACRNFKLKGLSLNPYLIDKYSLLLLMDILYLPNHSDWSIFYR